MTSTHHEETTSHRPPCASLSRAAGRAFGLALTCSLGLSVAASPLALAQQESQPAEQEREGSGWLRRGWGAVRPQDQQQPQQPATQAEQARPQQPATAERAAAPAPAPDELIRISKSSEPVSIVAFVDWVANQLQVNIFSDPGLDGQTVLFNGPLEVRRDELLSLLSMFVEQRGYAITADRPGWFVIKPKGEIAAAFGRDELATTRVIETPMVRPSSLQDAISKALGGAAGGGAGAGRVSFIDELGVLVITDSPRNIRAVEDVIRAVLGERDKMSMHRFELMHLSAEVAREKVLTLRGAGGQGSTFRTPTQPLGDGTQRGAQQVPGAAGGSLSSLPDRLFIDPASNSLIFRGSEAEAASLIEIISVVDTPSRLIANRYAVGPAAMQIAQFGEDEGLGPVRTIGTGVSSSRQFGSQQFQGQQQFGQQTGAQQGARTQSGPRFVLEDNMEAFVYFGTEAQHRKVQDLVAAFAEQARGARVVVEFYKLRHASAEQVAELLNAIIQDPASQSGASPFLPQSGTGARAGRPTIPSPSELGFDTPSGSGAGGEGDIGNALTPTMDITIQPDVARNQIAVRAPARQQREVAKIIEQLDQRRPQVYIEVQIVSVTASDDFRFAIESQLSPGQSVLFTNFGLTTVPQGGTVQDQRVVNPNLPGFTSAIIRSDYIPFVINAFQEVGDTRIVSSPRLLVNDNEEAEVRSLREEPFAETSQNSNTTITSQGGVAEAGTTLTVTPQISDAGMLNLTYALELSDFDRAAAGGASGLQPPTQRENYMGVVTLPSDATMVVGGLVRERNSKTVQKVPFLGDIPILGEFFKRTVDSKAQATIYVFITPRIVRDPTFADLRLLTRGPMQRVDMLDDLPELEPEMMPTSGATLLRRPDAEPPTLDPIEDQAPSVVAPQAQPARPAGPAPLAPAAVSVPARRDEPGDRPRPMGSVVIINEKEAGER